jgi:hypothetical protein
MRFFITGETYKTVGEKMRIAENQIEPQIESLFTDRDYGSGIVYWGHINICCPPEVYDSGFFKEIKKYTKKDKEVELRLKVDYDTTLHANEKEVFALICQSILRGVDIAEHELKIKDFDFGAFRDDVTTLFQKEGWI